MVRTSTRTKNYTVSAIIILSIVIILSGAIALSFVAVATNNTRAAEWQGSGVLVENEEATLVDLALAKKSGSIFSLQEKKQKPIYKSTRTERVGTVTYTITMYAQKLDGSSFIGERWMDNRTRNFYAEEIIWKSNKNSVSETVLTLNYQSAESTVLTKIFATNDTYGRFTIVTDALGEDTTLNGIGERGALVMLRGIGAARKIARNTDTQFALHNIQKRGAELVYEAVSVAGGNYYKFTDATIVGPELIGSTVIAPDSKEAKLVGEVFSKDRTKFLHDLTKPGILLTETIFTGNAPEVTSWESRIYEIVKTKKNGKILSKKIIGRKNSVTRPVVFNGSAWDTTRVTWLLQKGTRHEPLRFIDYQFNHPTNPGILMAYYEKGGKKTHLTLNSISDNSFANISETLDTRPFEEETLLAIFRKLNKKANILGAKNEDVVQLENFAFTGDDTFSYDLVFGTSLGGSSPSGIRHRITDDKF